MKFSVSEIFTFCCQSCKQLYVCWRSIIRLLAFYVCWRSIIRLRVTDFERFYVCWRSIIRLLAFYVCWRSIIRLLAFYVCWRFTFAGATPPPPVRNPWLPRDRRRSRHAFFMSFFFQVLRIFWSQVCENRSRGHMTFSHVGTKFAQNLHFACLCTKHMEITDFLKMH